MYISWIPDLNHHMWTNYNKSAADSTSEAAKLRSAWGRTNDWFVQITYDILFQTSVLLVVWSGTQRPVKSVSVATCPHLIHSHWNPSNWRFSGQLFTFLVSQQCIFMSRWVESAWCMQQLSNMFCIILFPRATDHLFTAVVAVIVLLLQSKVPDSPEGIS